MINFTQRGLFVTGTDTGVGKTRISAILAHLLNQRGLVVRPRKPVESGCLRDEGGLIPADAATCGLIPADAATLQAAAGSKELLAKICPYRFELALSPERAAALADKSLTLDDVTAVCREGVAKSDFLLVEGAGGFYSPLASDVLNADLAVALSLPVLLVTSDRLGAINQTLLAVEAIKGRGLTLAGVVLNQVAPAVDPQMDNAAELSRWLDEPVLATAYYKADSTEPAWLLPCPVLTNLVDRLTGGL
ncbi:MAG: dethiobiotin synthase [Methylobacter sp.]|nr:dethiobiotin synthase [Methylobacter sp.]MDP3054777.1 dethiobiotin synthase [Methylobacter sp.]MDP3361032.1 dethiobiotin synthase [Methylobacter sp.]MDZ4217482.1 dethiobiotin synthase [Methylobacter sp.]